MNQAELEAGVRQALAQIAPETAGETIDPTINFRDQLDFDSMDFLNFVIALHQRFGVDIAEADYPKLSNLQGCLRYLSAKVA